MNIELRRDHKRGCGWRKPGGKYLIGGSLCAPCGKLPHFLEPCPRCRATIKPIRGWRWIDPFVLFTGRIGCRQCHGDPCPLYIPPDRAGLIWIGDTFYTADEFVAEAARIGISRRIQCVPKGFELGKTLVLLASRKVLTTIVRLDVPRFDQMFDYKPAIFAAFVPTALQYVVRGDEVPEELERLASQGFTLVRIERVPESGGANDSRSESTRALADLAGPADLRTPGQRPEDGAASGGDGVP
jgi:hypothetical protein